MWPWIEVGPPTGSQNKCSDVDQENQAKLGLLMAYLAQQGRQVSQQPPLRGQRGPL